MSESLQPGDPISLALSGGGVRALAFHLGVLRYLAEQRMLERIKHVSSVSGGSLAVGLIMTNSGKAWPSSTDFLTEVYPAVKHMICSRSLMWDGISQLVNPLNWRFLLSRSNLIALALRKHWKLDFSLKELAPSPIWSINATTAENGKRFRFSGTTIGDYLEGYAEAPDLSVATAVAVSAAFPGGIGPLALNTADFQWKKREWNAPESTAKKVTLAFKTLHLYDGGVYDNLGLEPLFNAGTGVPKTDSKHIIVSDAGAPLKKEFSALALNPWRLKRVADIISDQARNLRVRTFMNYLLRAKTGAFIQIDSPLFQMDTGSDVDFACDFPTTLRRLSIQEFDRLADYAHEVTRRVHNKYGL